MNLSEIRDLVRAEGNIEGLREHQTLIDNIINQELQRMTGKAKFPELLISTSLDFTADLQYTIPIPVDFQLFSSINYFKSGDLEDGQNLVTGQQIGHSLNQWGTPRYFTRKATTFEVYPSLGTVLGDRLVLEYYKKPEMLLDTDSLPVPCLETALIQFTLGRILRMTNTQRAQMATMEGNQAFDNARAEHASI